MNSILFVIEGGPAAKMAGETAVALARTRNTNIDAQFVVDPQRIFELEGFCICGCGERSFCGSGVFIEAEQAIAKALVGLGESLLMFFTALAEGAGIRVEQYVDVGSKVQEIERRATSVDLVILGESAENVRASERLVATLRCPVLIVQSRADALLMEPVTEKSSLVPELVAQLESIGVAVTEREKLEDGLWLIHKLGECVSARINAGS